MQTEPRRGGDSTAVVIAAVPVAVRPLSVEAAYGEYGVELKYPTNGGLVRWCLLSGPGFAWFARV
jgi:hypothetical protein